LNERSAYSWILGYPTLGVAMKKALLRGIAGAGGAIVALGTIRLAHADVELWVSGWLPNVGLVDLATGP
jgi:hypothetical protein